MVRSIFEPLVAQGWMASASVLVVTPSETEFYGFGSTTAGASTPPTENTPYEVGSITKTFTALATAREIVAGGMSIDTPMQELVSFAVPDFQGTPIRIRDVVTHGSALPRTVEEYVHDAQDIYRDFDMPQLREWLPRYRLPRAPASEYEYSNVAVGWLGAVLAERAHMPYREYLQREVLAPLHMTDSWFAMNESAEHSARMPVPYDGDLQRLSRLHFTEAMVGAGGLVSTAADMARYMRAQVGIDVAPFAAAIDMTHDQHRVYRDGPTLGMAWFHGEHGALWHGGATNGFSSSLIIHPDSQFAVLVMANNEDAWSVVAEASMAVTDALSGQPPRDLHLPEPGQDDAAVVQQCVGSYDLTFNGQTGVVRMLADTSGKPSLDLGPDGRFRLTARVPGAYFSRTLPMAVLCEGLESGAFTRLHIVFLDGREYTAPRHH